MLTFSEWLGSDKNFNCPIIQPVEKVSLINYDDYFMAYYIAQYNTAIEPTVMYPETQASEYLSLGLLSELGEIAGVVKKSIRSGQAIDRDKLITEIGDFCWYAVRSYFFIAKSIDPNWNGDVINHIENRLLGGSKWYVSFFHGNIHYYPFSTEKISFTLPNYVEFLSRAYDTIQHRLMILESDGYLSHCEIAVFPSIEFLCEHINVNPLDMLNYNIYKLYQRLKTNTIKEHNDNG